MASAEDRPIIISGGEQMITVELPRTTTPIGGPHILKALTAGGPFKTIVFKKDNKPEFTRTVTGDWSITIE